MNILLVSDSNVERAGVCIFLFQWIQGIIDTKKDTHITVYFRKGIVDEDFADQYRKLGVDLVLGELPQNQTSLAMENRKKVRSDIRKILRKTHYDIVHINSSAVGFTTITLFEGIRANVPLLIVHSHGRNQNNGFKKSYLWILRYINKHIATKWAGCSIDAGEYLFGKHVENNKRWMFVPNTVSTELYCFNNFEREEKRKQLNIRDNELLLGATGGLNKGKNHQFLFPVIKDLINSGKDVKLVIFGDGELREELTKAAATLGIEKYVIIFGATKEVSKWLSAMDIYVMPSLTEGLPIGAVEAQANGLCCLLSDQIPRDVDICQDVYHLPIDQGPKPWTSIIANLSPKSTEDRKRGLTYVANAGFDRKNTVEYVRKLYDL